MASDIQSAENDPRKSLRLALIEQGFKRETYTDDLSGLGNYTESWSRGDDRVTIDWGLRPRPIPPGVQDGEQA